MYCHVVCVILSPEPLTVLFAALVAVILSPGTEPLLVILSHFGFYFSCLDDECRGLRNPCVCMCTCVHVCMYLAYCCLCGVVCAGDFSPGVHTHTRCILVVLRAQGLLPWLGGSVVCPWAHGFQWLCVCSPSLPTLCVETPYHMVVAVQGPPSTRNFRN